MRRMLFVALCALAVPAAAAEPAAPAAPATEAKPDADVEAAKAVLKQYLDTLIKAAEGRKPTPAQVSGKLAGAKKFIHPKTLELIATQEKNKVVTNALAVWHWAEADYWLKEFELGDLKTSVLGTVVAETREKNWRVEEQGEDGEWELDSYLLAPVKGKWLIIDKRRNETFTEKAIKIGYKEYFGEAKKEEPKKPEVKEE